MKYTNLIALGITAFIGNALGAVHMGSENSYAFLSEKTPFKYSEFKDLILFGDSYTTTFANTISLETDVKKAKNEGNYVNWPIYLIQDHPLNLWDFAVAGAKVNHTILECEGGCVPMTTQYSYFKNQMALGKKYSNWSGYESLVGTWFGINDLMAKLSDVYYNQKTQEESDEIDYLLAQSIFNILGDVYEEGARNFLINLLPPMEKFPYFIENVWEELEGYVLNYNKNVIEFAKNFQSKYPSANVFVYNAYDEFNYLLENSSQYNIENIDKYPEDENPDSSTYLWRDINHPTNRVQKIIAQDIEKFLSQQEKDSKKLTGYTGDSTIPKECNTLEAGYPCCSKDNNVAYFRDSTSVWGVADGDWCGILPPSIDTCWAGYIGLPCCSTDTCTVLQFQDNAGSWGLENDSRCGITSANTLCQ